MSKITLKEALRRVLYKQDREFAAQHRHSASTPQCPSLVRFFSSAFSGWSDAAERAHVSGCPYCQETTGQIWVERSPSLTPIVEYLLSPNTFPDREAMRYYLDQAGGRLEFLVGSLLRSRGLLDSATSAIAASLDNLRFVFGGLPDAPLSLASASSASTPAILLDREDTEAGLSFGLRTDHGVLQAFVRTLDGTPLKSPYRLSVYGPAERLLVKLTVGSHEASANLGSTAILLPRIGSDCLVTLEPAEDA